MADTIIELRVVPNARRDEIIGAHGGLVKVRCRAPALDDRANEAVISILAERLGIRRSQLELVRGQKSRTKTVAVSGLDDAEVRERLALGGAEPRK